MLLSALTVCDEVFEARRKIADLEHAADALDAETMGGAGRVIDAAARRVGAIAAKLDQT